MNRRLSRRRLSLALGLVASFGAAFPAIALDEADAAATSMNMGIIYVTGPDFLKYTKAHQ